MMIVRHSQGSWKFEWRLIRLSMQIVQVVHPLEPRAFVFWYKEEDLDGCFGFWNFHRLLMLDEEDRSDTIQHQRQSEIEHFDELVEFVLNRQIFHFRLRAVELDVRPAPGAQDVIVDTGVECEVERSFSLEIIFAVGELKCNNNQNKMNENRISSRCQWNLKPQPTLMK